MAKKNEVSVFAPDGSYIRTYSEEMHGKDFKKLAAEFAGKVKGRKVETGEVKEEVKERGVDLGKMSVAKLNEYAKKEKIDVEGLKSKKEIVKAIKKAKEDQPEPKEE